MKSKNAEPSTRLSISVACYLVCENISFALYEGLS